MNISEEQKTVSLWTCPRCGRELSEPEAVHGCKGRSRAEYAATTLFSSSAPQVYDWFMDFAGMVAASGPSEIKVERNQIIFCDKQTFALVRAEREAMLVGLIFADLDNQERFISIEQLDDGSWLHTVRVRRHSDLDEKLAGWLQRAHRETVDRYE